MLRRIPNDLPLFGLLGGGFGFLAYGFTGMVVEMLAGRPSSTASLGMLFIPVWAAIIGFAGLFAGILAEVIWRVVKPSGQEHDSKRINLWLALLVIIIGSSFTGAFSVFRHEWQSRPVVLFDSGTITTVKAANKDSTIGAASLLYEGSLSSRQDFSWGRNETRLDVQGLDIRLSDLNRSKSVVLNAYGLDYVNSVHAASFISSTDDNMLFVAVITGRATGHRALIVVLDSGYQILYQHRIERFWCYGSNPLEIRRSSGSMDEIAVIGPSCKEPLILRVRSGT